MKMILVLVLATAGCGETWMATDMCESGMVKPSDDYQGLRQIKQLLEKHPKLKDDYCVPSKRADLQREHIEAITDATYDHLNKLGGLIQRELTEIKERPLPKCECTCKPCGVESTEVVRPNGPKIEFRCGGKPCQHMTLENPWHYSNDLDPSFYVDPENNTLKYYSGDKENAE